MSGSPSSDVGVADSGSSDRPVREEVSAGGVVIREIGGRPHVLVILDPYGKWALPKGHLEGDESEVEAAVREVREETGLEQIETGPTVRTIDWFFHRDGARIDKRCTFFLMRSDEGEIRPERTEGITDCTWLPLTEAADRIGYENTGEVVRAAKRMLEEDRMAEAWE